jgi:DNA modification methylase
MTERIYWLAKTHEVKITNTVNRHDLWQVEPEGLNNFHNRAFPLEIPKTIISVCPQYSLVLDPFLGSGTTARAAKDLGRKCIGIEIEEKYCAIAARRMAQSVMRLE